MGSASWSRRICGVGKISISFKTLNFNCFYVIRYLFIAVVFNFVKKMLKEIKLTYMRSFQLRIEVLDSVSLVVLTC